MKTFLHVGCGYKRKNETTSAFDTPEWRELRVDLDPDTQPDVVADIRDMQGVATGSMDALYSSHNIEHFFAHEIEQVLGGFRRVLKPDGFLVITCPDLQSICQLVAEDKLLDTAYDSNAGPITPLDVLYGHRASLAQGKHFMAHRCGFTLKVLMGTLQAAGFDAVVGSRRGAPYFDLWVLACPGGIDEANLRRLALAHFPA